MACSTKNIGNDYVVLTCFLNSYDPNGTVGKKS